LQGDRNKMVNFTVASLFSGAGGLDLGFAQTGKFSILFANDVLDHMTRTYSEAFGVHRASDLSGPLKLPVVLRADVTSVSFDQLEDIEIDVLTGGPPCQDFSIVRGPDWDRRGFEVARGRLYSHFVRGLATLRPKVFVFENVPGLVSANKKLAYRQILEDFHGLGTKWDEIGRVAGNTRKRFAQGYETVYDGVVDAAKLGVPQMRRRLIVIGLRRDLLEKNPLALGSLRDLAHRTLSGEKMMVSKYPLTPIEVFEGKPLDALEREYAEVMREYDGVAGEVGTPRALAWGERVWSKLTFDAIEDYLTLNDIRSPPGREIDSAMKEHRRILGELGYLDKRVEDLKLENGTTEPLRESPSVLERMRRVPPGENHEFVRGTRWEVEGRGISLVYRRAHPLIPAPTIVAYGGGGTWGYHYARRRGKLTHRERARLQTFPDDFPFSGSVAEIRAQIGEAVPPLMARTIGGVVTKILEIAS